MAVCALNNITKGTSDPTKFAPLNKITRQQVITMVVRAADNLAPGTLEAVPADWNDGVLSYSDPTHGPNIKKAEYNGLLAGIRASLATPGLTGWNTGANASRGEVAQILWNLLSLTRPEPASGDLLHFWWEWDGPWKNAHVESVTAIAGGPEITGPIYRTPWVTGSSTIVATGENGHLLVYTVADGRHDWSLVDVSTATGQTVAPGTLVGPRREVPSTGPATLNIAALNSSADLLHFHAIAGGTWNCVNVSMATGHKVAALSEDTVAVMSGSAVTLHFFGRTPAGDLIDFQRPSGGAWLAVNVSAATGLKIQGAPMFFSDDTLTPSPMLTWPPPASAGGLPYQAAPVPLHQQGGVERGGRLGRYRHQLWRIRDEHHEGQRDREPPPCKSRQWPPVGAAREARRRCPPLRRPPTSPRSSVRHFTWLCEEHTVFTMPTHPAVPATETHFMGINTGRHLVEFWADAQGTWRKEDLSDTVSQPVIQQHRLVVHLSPPSDTQRNNMGMSPDGHLVIVWGDPGTRAWEAFDASAAMGYE